MPLIDPRDCPADSVDLYYLLDFLLDSHFDFVRDLYGFF